MTAVMKKSVAAFLLIAALMGCATEEQPPTAAAPAALPPILPFDQAVENAAVAVLSANQAAVSSTRVIVIDPLVDGVTGEQSVATRQIGTRIAALVGQRFPNYRIEPFSAASVAQRPLVMVGTFTAVNAQNQTAGERAAYRFCLVLADLDNGRVAAKSVARAQLQGVDASPAGLFGQSPIWSEDPATRSYVNTCQTTRAGDPVPPPYLAGIEAAALVQEAAVEFEAERYLAALGKYQAARQTSAGDQLRVHNGLYLTNRRLRREAAASEAFDRLVDYGLEHQRLAVKLLFRPGTTAFAEGPDTVGEYPRWLRSIARQAGARTTCLEVRGHTSSSGATALNERLSAQRAETVRTLLVADNPSLGSRVIATGAGSREALIGTGRDDLSDLLDRRVEFRVVTNCG
jgi:outer membrane protein OmpA-like peptidoglycan-associated protein